MSLSLRILRRLAWFGVAYLAMACAVLVAVAREHVRIEADQGALAAFLVHVERVRAGDADALAQLAAMRSAAGIRHLDFELRRDGRPMLPARPSREDRPEAQTQAQRVAWTDAQGAAWTLELRPDSRAELAEVATDAALLAVLMLGLAVLLAVGVIGSVRAETAPLAALRGAISAYARGDFAARVPALKIREFDAIGRALNALADALHESRARAQALSRQLVAAEDAQNRAIAGELHDELGQWLTAARVDAAFLRAQTQGVAREAADSLERALMETVARVRGLLERLRPHGLQDDPLPAGALERAVRELVASWQARRGVAAAIELSLDLPARPLPNAVAMAAYRVVQESLSNAMRHGGARRVVIRISQQPDGLQARVEDDGCASADACAPGRGLAGLAERVDTLGGTLAAGPQPTGWQVLAWLPCAAL